MFNLSPIILFAYNRPEHTKRTLDALAKNEESKWSILYIYCDGPKDNMNELQLENIQKVRRIAKDENRFKEVKIIERQKNYGLATSIISGVQEVISKHNSIIVLEDDILTSAYFLKFMNDALYIYKNESKVISIGACNYFALGENIPNSFFMPIPDCLGWATWSDRWSLFESDSQKLLIELSNKQLIEKFNLYGFYKFYNMLKAQSEGKVSSWAIRWQAVAYLNNMVTLYPNPSLTQHIQSEEATHAANLNITPPLAKQSINITKQKPKLKKNIFYLMIKAYHSYLSNSKIVKLKKQLKFYFFWIKNKKRIIKENQLN